MSTQHSIMFRRDKQTFLFAEAEEATIWVGMTNMGKEGIYVPVGEHLSGG